MEFSSLTHQANAKQTNRNRIYQLVYNVGAISKPEIAQNLKISLPTAIQNVKSLQEDGLLKEGEPLKSTGGRKAVGITCVRNAKYAVGIDITKNHISMVLINLFADIIGSMRVEKLYENTLDYYMFICRIVKDLIAHTGVEEKDILGAGFSLPGPISEDGLTLVYSHVLRVSNIPASTFGRGLPFPLVLCNDANAAGVAEMWSSKTLDNAVYLSLSNSVGGAVIIDNKLYWGENQRAGEFGHMTLVRDGLPCYCGRKGCVDSYCSAQALSRHSGENQDSFFEQIQSGNQSFHAVWQQYLSYLSTVINNLTVAFDCTVILGGYVGKYLEEHIEILRSNVAAQSLFAGNENYIKICKYKQEAAAVGAALLHIQPFIFQV